MVTKKDSGLACNLLEARISLCDNLQNLMLWATGVNAVNEGKLRGYVNQSSASWAGYPWVLQCRICSRFAAEALAAACKEVKSDVVAAEQPSNFKTHLSDFARHFTWDNPLSNGEMEYQFCGSDPMMQHLIAGLAQRYEDAENEAVTVVLGDDDFDMEGSAAMKAVRTDLQDGVSCAVLDFRGLCASRATATKYFVRLGMLCLFHSHSQSQSPSWPCIPLQLMVCLLIVAWLPSVAICHH